MRLAGRATQRSEIPRYFPDVWDESTGGACVSLQNAPIFEAPSPGVRAAVRKSLLAFGPPGAIVGGIGGFVFDQVFKVSDSVGDKVALEFDRFPDKLNKFKMEATRAMLGNNVWNVKYGQ